MTVTTFTPHGSRKSYRLPTSIAVALSTGRPELIGTLEMDAADQLEVLRLIGDMIADRKRLDDQLAKLNDAFEEAQQTIEGNLRRVARELADVGADE